MNDQHQQHQRPPQDSKQPSSRSIKIESDMAANSAGGGIGPPPLPPQASAVAKQPYAPPAKGVVQHGVAQPKTAASVSAVPNPLAPPGPKISNGQPIRYPPLPGSSGVIKSNNKRPRPGPAPPITMPPIPEHDPKEMEERRKKALAYAMSNDISGGAKGRKRHAAKLAAAKKKAAIAAAKAKSTNAQYNRTAQAQVPPGKRVNYSPGATITSSLQGSNTASTPSAVANPLASFAPKPPPPKAPNASTSTQYFPVQSGGAAPAVKNGAAGWPRKQQMINTNGALEPPPKRGRPRKDISKAAPVKSGIGTGLHVGFSDSNDTMAILAEAASNSSSATVPNDAFAPLPLRRSYDDESIYDPEYARFMRSLMADDQSILTFKTLQSIRSVGGGTEGPPLGTIVGDGSMIESAFGTLDEDDASYQLTSDEDEEDEDDEDEEGDNDIKEEEKDDDKVSKMKVDSPARGTRSRTKALELPSSSSVETKPQSVDSDDLGIFHDEIEGLMEEDLEAAVASLIGVSPEGEFSSGSWQTGAAPTGKNAAMAGTEQAQAITTPGQSTKKKKSTATIVTSPTPVIPAAATESNAPSVNSRTARAPPVVSQEQLRHLRATMARHHQLLLQQATLAVRAAYVQKVVGKPGKSAVQNRTAGGMPPYSPPNQNACSYQNDFFAGESPEELSDCLDSSVSMLQDLEQHWKDAVRNSIQLAFRENNEQTMSRRKLLHSFGVTQASSSSHDIGADATAGNSNQSDENRRLTRSAFTKTLIEREMKAEPMPGQFKPPTRQRVSVFEIRGLARLRETFTAIDNSVKDIYIAKDKKRIKNGINILAPHSHSQACNTLLNHAKADVDPDYVPGQLELYSILTHAPEAFSDEVKGQDPTKVKSPLTRMQKLELRKNRNQFTAGEDNLILRGVNLYGEKEWVLVSDRFLPDRQVNHIAQRYNRLCFLIYKASGVSVGDKGELPPMPKIGKSGTYDEEKANEIKPAEAPTTMNVHRWTLEEDIAILKAVPIFGSCWADISSKLMPHRDRGHIRKRFQVLERRMPKGVCKVNLKRMFANRSPPAKPPKKPRTSRGSPKKPTPTKSITLNEAVLPPLKSSTAQPSIETPMSPIKSSVQSSGPFSHGQHGFGNGKECYSPETKGAAALLGVFSGFSQESQHGDDTRMGVLKILEIADGKMADSNFGDGGAPRSPMKSSSDLLDDKTPERGRPSILNSVLDNVRRKDYKNDYHGSTPSKVDFNSYLATTTMPSLAATQSNEASSTMPFNLGTPSKEEGKSQSSMDGRDFARLFMPDNSHQTPLKTGLESPAKAGTTLGSNFSPIKLGNIAPPTPITHLGSLGFSGPVDGMNSLFMGASDLDAVAALKDLSNSNPGTPAKETVPVAAAAAAAVQEEETNERKCKRPKTSFFGQVQANVDKRKTG